MLFSVSFTYLHKKAISEMSSEVQWEVGRFVVADCIIVKGDARKLPLTL